MTSESSGSLPFRPEPRDFAGHAMPVSVPAGMRLELSRARLIDGREPEFEDWMSMLNSRPEELQAALPAERAVFEATFRSREADGSTWIYHLSLMGRGSGGLDETIPIAAEHGTYSRRVKEPGWEELEPFFMLAPAHLVSQMKKWAATGKP